LLKRAADFPRISLEGRSEDQKSPANTGQDWLTYAKQAQDRRLIIGTGSLKFVAANLQPNAGECGLESLVAEPLK